MIKNLLLSLSVLLFFFGCTTAQQPKNCFDKNRLEQREFTSLQNAKTSLAHFKSEYAEMSAYIDFLNGFVADYTKYISAASGASAAIGYMPIPYAGQISSAANFGAKITTLAANASKSVATLNASVKEFEEKLAAYEKDGDPKKLTIAHKYAKETLKADIDGAKESLLKLQDGASSLLAVSSAISDYYTSTEKLLNKASNIFSKNEKKPANKEALKARNSSFAKRLTKTIADFESSKGYIREADTINSLVKEL